MKIIFTSLLCHRDVAIFKFNWFVMRVHLDRGFDIPHLILHDGSLTESDFKSLEELTNIIIEKEPIQRYPIYKDIYWGKIQCLKRAFEKHGADRAILFDCDIFFLRNWDADLRKMISEKCVVLRDWGSSVGPSPEKFFQIFGCREDASTPNCNTGVISILKEDYHKLEESFKKYLNHPITTVSGPIVAEDQAAVLASFYGEISYVNGIKCLITNIESNPNLWNWALQQNAVHLMGMRTRPRALCNLVAESLKNLPETISLEQITPIFKYVSWGLMEYGHYNFNLPLQKIPSTYHGQYLSNSLNMHGGSKVTWNLPKHFTQFKCEKVVCLDTGIPNNVKNIYINNDLFKLENNIKLNLNGKLQITIDDGPGTHLAFIKPELVIDKKTWPNLEDQKI